MVNDYRDWGIPLGRRFRALKLWSVIRYYGVRGLQGKIRLHISLARELEAMIRKEPDFEVLAPVILNTVCFRFNPGNKKNDELNILNENINHILNDSGRIYLTHTSINGIYTLRMVTSQTNVSVNHVKKAWELIRETSRNIS